MAPTRQQLLVHARPHIAHHETACRVMGVIKLFPIMREDRFANILSRSERGQPAARRVHQKKTVTSLPVRSPYHQRLAITIPISERFGFGLAAGASPQ